MKRTLFLIFLFCTFAFNLSANDSSIDNDSSKIVSLIKLSYQEYNRNNISIAIKLCEKAQTLIEQNYGKFSTNYANCLSYIIAYYTSLGDYNSAIKYANESLDIQEKTIGKEHPNYGIALSNLSACYFKLSKYNNAIIYAKKALNIIPKDNPYYAITISNIAASYTELRDYKNALIYAKKALDIQERTIGKEHPDYAITLLKISQCYRNIPDYNNAISYAKEALNILTQEHQYYTAILNVLANSYYKIGNYGEAITYNKKILNLTEKTHHDYAIALNNIANCYSQKGDYNTAISYAKEALVIFDLTIGKQHPYYANNLQNLASYLHKIGKPNEAILYVTEALNIYGKTSKEHPDYAIALNSLANYYKGSGDYNNAILHLQEALIIQEHIIGKEHPDYALTLINIAQCFDELGDGNKAIDNGQKALAIQEKALGKSHPLYALTLSNIATFYHKLGNYNLSIEYLLKALDIQEKTLGKVHPDYANSLNNIGVCYDNLGDYNKALECHLQALNIQEKALGKEHPARLTCLQNIAYSHLEYHNNAFVSSAKEFTELNIASICKTFVDLSLNERKLFWDKHSYWYDGPIHQGVCEFNDASLLPTAYNSVLFSKGLLLNAEIAMRDLLDESNDATAINVYNELLSTRSMLNKQYELTIEKRYLSTDSLEKRADELERIMINTSKAYGDYTRNLQLNWKDVQNKLTPSDIAIEFASFNHNDSTTYIAYILKKGYNAPAYKKILTHHNNKKLNNSEIYLSADFSKTIWGALSEELKGVKNIYFAPSGELYNIAIESLPYWENSSLLVSDKWNLFRLSSTRELALNKERYNTKSATVYGGLKYDTATNQLGSTDEFNYSSLDIDVIGLRSGVEYLPGSYDEAVLIDKLLKSNKINDKLYLGEAGTETTLKALGGKRNNMLHIATHGFYWTEREARRMDYRFLNNMNKNVEDKMLSRSGLLFSGANNILSGKEIHGNIDDGVLTAEEISRIDLLGLDMLVLSACQTGLGEISGDGVFGLQRGFKKAGAQSILMSLWNVDDKATQLFMSKFYELLLNGKNNKRNAHLNAQQFVKNYEIDLNSISSHELEYYKENGAVINYNTGKVKPFSNHRFWAAFILLDAI